MPAGKRKPAAVAADHKSDVEVTVKRGKSIDQSSEGDTKHDFKSQYFSCKSNDLKLGREFFNQPCVCLAKALLGKVRRMKHVGNTFNNIMTNFSQSLRCFSSYQN